MVAVLFANVTEVGNPAAASAGSETMFWLSAESSSDT